MVEWKGEHHTENDKMRGIMGLPGNSAQTGTWEIEEKKIESAILLRRAKL